MSENGGKPSADLDALRQEIKQTRVELGETVEALVAKVDVKARLQSASAAALARTRDALPVPAQQAAAVVRTNWRPLAAVAGAVFVVIVFVKWRNGRRNR